MRYYPLFLDIAGRKCVVVGGGGVAERKVERLLACGARVEVVAKSLTPLLAAWKGQGKVVHHDSDYRDTSLAGAVLVIGATDDREVNGRIAADARLLGIPVNIADDPVRCDFILPAILEQGDLSIAVSTGGRSPALAKKIRQELEAVYGSEYAVLLEILGELRERVIARGRPSDENRGSFEAVVASEILDLIRAGRWGEVKDLIRQRTGIVMEIEPR